MSSVVYVGRIPHGFYEDQMRSYFSQFGPIVNLRLSRNKKTGASKHYAFIEFESADVAKTVAETMDQYLLFNSLLQCQVVPKDKIHASLWIGANKKFKVTPSAVKIRQYNERISRTATQPDSEENKRKLAKKQKKMKKKLEFLSEFMDFKPMDDTKDTKPIEKGKKSSPKSPSNPLTRPTAIVKVEPVPPATPTTKRKSSGVVLKNISEDKETPKSSKRIRAVPNKYSPKSPLYSTPRKTPRKH